MPQGSQQRIMEGRSRKRGRKNNKKREDDRLSLLPNDIIIGILSRLPIQSAIVTDVLSKRWRGLWTHITSILVDYDSYAALDSDLDRIILHRIVSPSINRFSVEYFARNVDSCQRYLKSWLCRMSKRNVLEIDLTWPADTSFHLPAFIYQTTSLVSIELKGYIRLCNEGAPIINLPNLKKLSLFLNPSNWETQETLISNCPSLEELFLGFYYGHCEQNRPPFKCSSSSLRRLSLNLMRFDTYVVINAPKLEYFDVRGMKPETLSFDHKPIIGLREAKIVFPYYKTIEDITKYYSSRDPDEIIKSRITLLSEIYKAISKVSILTLYICVIDDIPSSTMFRNVAQLRINMIDFKAVLRFLGHCLCPALDVLILNFDYVSVYEEEEWRINDPKRECINTLGRVKRIEIHTTCCCSVCYKSRNFFPYFSEVVKYLLMNALVLEHFKFEFGYSRCRAYGSAGSNTLEREETMFCNLLKECYPKVSIGCEVQLVGRCLTMSLNAGSQIRRSSKLNGEVVNIID